MGVIWAALDGSTHLKVSIGARSWSGMEARTLNPWWR
jgi:hypothetical protein